MENRIINLRFREADRDIFEAVRLGKKKVETRAATQRFLKAKKGDFVILSCGEDKFEKEIKSVKRFKTISSILRKYKAEDINPMTKSKEELQRMYYSFPGYREKIKKHGLIAFEF